MRLNMKAMKNILYLVIVISLLSTSCRVDPKKRFVLSPKEALKAANNQTNVITPSMLADILFVKDSTLKYNFVDLRSPLEFDAGHIDGAVNIPFSSMTRNNNCKTFLDKDAINILYGSSTEEVVFAGFILKQIGVDNYFLIHGEYNSIKDNVINHYNVMSASFNPEIPKYDFEEIMKKGKGGGASVSAASSPSSKLPIKRNKKEAAGGGCD